MLLCGAAGHAQSHLDTHLDHLRKSGKTESYRDGIRGMTPPAARDIRGVAELLVGVSILTINRDPSGALVWTYAPSSWWVLPGDYTSGGLRLDQLRVMTERDRFDTPLVRARITTWVRYLKKLGDADGSGFVNTAEGRTLRRRIELGFLLCQFRTAPTIRELARMLREEPTQVAGDLTAYVKMREAAIRDGMGGFPALPEGLLGAA
jgi:hypothetical protein